MLEEKWVDTSPSSSSPQELSLSLWLWLQTAALPTSEGFLRSAAICKGGAITELSTPTQYPMFILLCHYSWEICSPYFSADHQTHYQGGCQFMHSINGLKLKRTCWSGGTVPEKTECTQENENFQEALLTHTCLQLDILVHGKPLLAKPSKIPVWHLTYCNSCPRFICCGTFPLPFYLWWHIKTIEKCKNNAKNKPEKDRWLNNRENKKRTEIAE